MQIYMKDLFNASCIKQERAPSDDGALYTIFQTLIDSL